MRELYLCCLDKLNFYFWINLGAQSKIENNLSSFRACLQLGAGLIQAVDADLIGRARLIICQTDGAESPYTKQPRLLLLE